MSEFVQAFVQSAMRKRWELRKDKGREKLDIVDKIKKCIRPNVACPHDHVVYLSKYYCIF